MQVHYRRLKQDKEIFMVYFDQKNTPGCLVKLTLETDDKGRLKNDV